MVILTTLGTPKNIFCFNNNIRNDNSKQGHPGRTSLVVLYSQNYSAGIRGGGHSTKFYTGRLRPEVQLGLSRLCSATFEQLLAFGATFCGFSNLEQVLPFRAIFEQNIGLEHISSTKKSTISWKTSIHANFLKAYHVINLLNT